MTDVQKSDEKRYYFRRGQIVMILAGFAITAVIIYFLGLLTGMHMKEKMLVNQEDSLSRIPVQPLLEGADSIEGGKLEKDTPPPNLTPAPSKSVVTKQEQRSRDKQPEQLAKSEVKSAEPRVKKSKSTVKEKAVGKVDEKTSAVPAKGEESSQAKGGGPKTAAGTWTVQVNSYPDEASAVVWEYALRKRGYDAYTVKAQIGTKTWYRVRVGSVATQDEAESLRKNLATKEGFGDAFLARKQTSDVIVGGEKSK